MIKNLNLVEAKSYLNSTFEEALKDSGLRAFSFSEESVFRAYVDPVSKNIESIMVFRKLAHKLFEIDFIATKNSARRKGFAQELIKSLGRVEIWLELKSDNNRALSFYKGMGFDCVGTRKSYYEDGSDALNMVKKAGPGAC